jgi:lysophospholipase L1-like esterase
MKHFYFFIASTLFLAQPLIAQSEKQDFHQTKWESAVEKFEAAEETKPVPQNAILFVGSSSIRLWNLEESFPDLVTINRGFGGSQLADSVQFVDRLVLKHKPRVIVMYAGDNDINAKKSPERVFADFAEFVAITRKNLPETTLHFIAIKPSIARWNLVDKVRRTNALIHSYCEMDDKLFFVDIDSPMLDTEGKLKPELFIEDGLHLSESGYAIWKKELLESLKRPGGMPARQKQKSSEPAASNESADN